MYLAPDGEEAEIAAAASDFLASAMPIDRLHAAGSADMSAELRGLLGEMGWFAPWHCRKTWAAAAFLQSSMHCSFAKPDANAGLSIC